MANKRASEMQHVVAVPYPAQGHIIPMLQLCQQLALFGFSFTFVNTHHIHRRLESAHPNRRLVSVVVEDGDVRCHLDLPKGSSKSVCNDALIEQQKVGVEHAHSYEARNLSIHGMQTANQKPIEGLSDAIQMAFVEGGCPPEAHAHSATLLQAFKAAQRMQEAVEHLISSVMNKRRVSFILTDILLSWSSATASKFNLPWVAFWPASASSCTALIYFAELAQQGKCFPLAELDLCVLNDIPGLPPTDLRDLPRVCEKSGSLKREWLRPFGAAREARFLLFNTFEELEGQVLQALSERQYGTLAVGPLLPSPYLLESMHTRPGSTTSTKETCVLRASLFKEDRSCLDWLDKQPPSSVLFISFGSISARPEEQLGELALAVEGSGCPYLWVCKQDNSAGVSAERLGAGKSQQSVRGMVVPWVPQLDVLAHRAVGGFVTHCGWNSVIEGVAMGVPMLCWADTGERMANQRLVVHAWKCGLDMVPDGRRYKQHIDEAVLLRCEEIQNSIRCLMVEEHGASIRARAAHLRASAVAAFRHSSSKFNHFVQAMDEHIFLHRHLQQHKSVGFH